RQAQIGYVLVRTSVIDTVPPIMRGHRTSPRSVFPLRFARQPVMALTEERHHKHEGLRSIPSDSFDRKTVVALEIGRIGIDEHHYPAPLALCHLMLSEIELLDADLVHRSLVRSPARFAVATAHIETAGGNG